MNRSGMKRGLAATAVSGLAIAGLPFLASPASAVPLTTGIGADAVTFYSQQAAGVSGKDDGSNSTISLIVGGGANVTSVQFQATFTPGGTPVNIGSPVARNDDGVFAFDWSPDFPTGTTAVQFSAVPNTGLGNTATSDTKPVLSDAVANTVELDSEGSRGVFQKPVRRRRRRRLRGPHRHHLRCGQRGPRHPQQHPVARRHGHGDVHGGRRR